MNLTPHFVAHTSIYVPCTVIEPGNLRSLVNKQASGNPTYKMPASWRISNSQPQPAGNTFLLIKLSVLPVCFLNEHQVFVCILACMSDLSV